ncbi:hypothetical protein [Candidatus Electronema sp. JC]|uniref:hypothetical protein n=1 Tax=Candidatus Electronema sp. JC TaxID=3401570 RepID=UPI003B42F1AD
MKIPQHKNHRRIVMLALRQIHTTQNQQILIKLPPEFDAYEKIEVIILPVEFGNSSPLSAKEFVKRFAGVIPAASENN